MATAAASALIGVLAMEAPAAAAARTVDVPRRASLVLRGAHPGDRVGASVVSAGDFNGDGRAHVVFGSPGANAAYVVTAG